MKSGADIVVRAAAKLYLPLMLVFAAALLASRPAGAGIGVVAGLAGGMALTLHLIVFGADAARAALPGWAARLGLALGVIAALAGAGASQWPHGARVLEAGAFVSVVCSMALVLQSLAGRAPTLRDDHW